MLPPAINRIFQAHFIVNSNFPPLKLTFSPTSWLEDASFPYLGIRFWPPFFPSASWPSVSSNGPAKIPWKMPTDQIRRLNCWGWAINSYKTLPPKLMRSVVVFINKKSCMQPRSCEGWVDDIDDILVVEFWAGKWSILIPEIVLEYIGP